MLLSSPWRHKSGPLEDEIRGAPQQEIIHLVDTGQKTAADAARLFNVHPSTVARLMARSHSAEGTSA